MRAYLLLLSVLLLGSGVRSQDTTFLYYNTWSFENFDREETLITWDMFREAFIGIPPDKNDANPFEQLIFDEVYKKLFPEGHCFGMALMAQQILKYGGYGGFCSPTFIYPGIDGPDDSILEYAIQMEHGRQLGHRFLLHTLDLIAAAKNRDGNFAYSQFLYYQSRNEPTVLNITEAFLPTEGGHTMLPYDAEDLGSKLRIYVYDENRCFHMADNTVNANAHHDWYMHGENFVEITKSTGAWRFLKPDYDDDDGDGQFEEAWSGSASSGLSGGNLTIMPFSLMNIKDRLPQSLFADAAEAIGKIFIYAGSEIKQISTPDGRVLNFDKNIETLQSVYPFVPFNGAKSIEGSSRLFFIRGEEDFDIQFYGGDNLEMKIFSETHLIILRSEVPRISGSIQIRKFNSNEPVVTSPGKNVSIEIQPYRTNSAKLKKL